MLTSPRRFDISILEYGSHAHDAGCIVLLEQAIASVGARTRLAVVGFARDLARVRLRSLACPNPNANAKANANAAMRSVQSVRSACMRCRPRFEQASAYASRSKRPEFVRVCVEMLQRVGVGVWGWVWGWFWVWVREREKRERREREREERERRDRQTDRQTERERRERERDR